MGEVLVSIRNLSIIFVLALLLLPVVHADRFVEQEVFSGSVQSDGTLVPSQTPLSDVNVVGYVCQDASCSASSGELFPVTTTGSDNAITITYPTNLASPHGYGLFFYKPGYLTWEVKSNWFGTDNSDPQGPFPAYLTRVEGCRAPVDTFEVINEALPNQPIMINMTTSLDATVRSALDNAGPLDLIPAHLQPYYQVETRIVLEILDENGTIVHQETRDVAVDFSGEQRVEFVYVPTQTGRYTAQVTTEVIDPKCSSQFSEFADKQFSIIEQGPTELCYALLNNLVALPPQQDVGQSVDIDVESIANYYDANGDLHALPADLTLEVTRYGQLEYTQTKSVVAGSVDQPADVAFTFTPTKAGDHVITISAQTQSCPFSDEIADTVSQSYFVKGSARPIFQALPSVTLDKDSGLNADLFDLDTFAFDPENDPLTFAIAFQTHPDIVDCFVDTGNMISCDVQVGKVGTSDVTVSLTDGTSFEFETFTVTVQGLSPGDVVLDQVDVRLDGTLFSDIQGGEMLTTTVGAFTLDHDIFVTNTHPSIAADDIEARACIIGYGLVPVCGALDIADIGAGATVLFESDIVTSITTPDVYQVRVTVDDRAGRIATLDYLLNVTDIVVPLAQCQDGIDNDGDGLIDLADPGCSGPMDNDESDDPATFDLFIDSGYIPNAPITDNESAVVRFLTHRVPDTVGGPSSVPVDVTLNGQNIPITTLPFPSSSFDWGIAVGTLAAGNYQLRIVTDPADVYAETNENNNEFVFDFTVDVGRIPTCSDGFDNDGDLYVDLADPDCTSPDDEEDMFNGGLTQCSDGLDNDGDGLIDLADPGCSSPADTDESDGTSQCQDGIDNDGDGAIDFPADFACTSPQDNDESDAVAECQDGIDNDFDGLIDLADPDCSTSQDDSEDRPPQTPECRDGIDNDNDGLIDAADPACQRGMQHEAEDPAVEERLFLPHIRLVNDQFADVDNELAFHVAVTNNGETDMKNVKIVVAIPELGLRGSVGPFVLDQGHTETRRIIVPSYGLLTPGVHFARISVYSEGDLRVRHREFIVE